jgi:hypothetical protein
MGALNFPAHNLASDEHNFSEFATIGIEHPGYSAATRFHRVAH